MEHFKKPCFVYMLRCADGTLYTGTAVDVERRLETHLSGKGAKYVRGRLPAQIAYRESCADKSMALRRELAIKGLTRQEKERLIQWPMEALLWPEELTMGHFVAMAALERRCYGKEYITPPEEAFRWYQTYPKTAIAALAGERVAGFINLFPIPTETYDRLREGAFNDRDMELSDLVGPEQGTQMFLCCIAVDRIYRAGGLTGELLRRGVEAYAPWEERMDRLITDNVTPAGMRLSERLGLIQVGGSDHGSRVYEGTYQDFAARIRQGIQVSIKK